MPVLPKPPRLTPEEWEEPVPELLRPKKPCVPLPPDVWVVGVPLSFRSHPGMKKAIEPAPISVRTTALLLRVMMQRV